MLARFFQRLVNSLRYGTRLGPLIGRFQPWDDFYWPRYNKDFYRREISRVGYLDRLSETSWSIENARIIVSSKRDLHPNHRLIYETALNLRPRAITEIGCGGGDHLANLKLLLPEVYLVGFDVSADQLEFARERNFADDGVVLHRRDMTEPDGAHGFERSADLVYTNSVLMHIHGGKRPERFVQNMAVISRRYILLEENWWRHNYLRLIQSVLPDARVLALTNSGALGLLIDLNFGHGSCQVDGIKVSSDRDLQILLRNAPG